MGECARRGDSDSYPAPLGAGGVAWCHLCESSEKIKQNRRAGCAFSLSLLVAKVMHDGGHIAQQPQRQQQPKQQAHNDRHDDISRVHGDAREARSQVQTDARNSGDNVSLAAKPPAMAAIDQAARQPRAIGHQSRLCRLRCAKRRSST
jgi:hypothetical protein